MIIVVDANLLLRQADSGSALHPVAVAAMTNLRADGEELRSLPQCFYEFWVVATRPVANNGMGLSTAETDVQLMKFEITIPLIPDPPDLYDRWKRLVVAHDCKGKVAHDARIVAAMQAHGVTHILTFNTADFARYPGIVVLDPVAIAAAAAP